MTTPQTPGSPSSAVGDYEHRRAIMEAERNDSTERWVAGGGVARNPRERAYEAGFTNGWDRALAAISAPAAEQQAAATTEGAAEVASHLHAEAACRLADLIDIYDDEQKNAPEHRCYVPTAWTDTLAEARKVVAQIEAAPVVQAAEQQAGVDYTYDRPVGELPKEIGSAVATLGALAQAKGIDMITVAEADVAHISQPNVRDGMRARYAAKPKYPADALRAKVEPSEAEVLDVLARMDSDEPYGTTAWAVSFARALLALQGGRARRPYRGPGAERRGLTMGWLKQLFCRHSGGVAFVRNIYGDEINHSGGKRSMWRCKRCDGYFPEQALNPPSEGVTVEVAAAAQAPREPS